MSDIGPRIAHRRMMKVVKVEAREEVAYSSQQSLSASGTMAPAQATVSPSPSSAPVVAALPVSTAAIVGVGAFLALLVIGVAGGCFWRRRKLRTKARSATIQFNRDVFAAEKKTYGLQEHVVADLSSIPMASPTETTPSPRIQHTPTDSESSTYAGWRPQVPAALRVTNQTTLTDKTTPTSSYLPTPTKALTQKKSLSQKHLKPLWSPGPEDLVLARSPPPAYDFSNGAPGLYIPSSGLQEQSPEPNTSASRSTPANHKPKKLNITAALTVPETEHTTLPSPARSESFAPKDLEMPQTDKVASLDEEPGFTATQTPPSSSGSTQTFNSGTSSGKNKLPRMMTVAAAYTPTLPDELRVTVGDTVRLLQEYKDGWGFVQYVGKIDSPKGVVPMVCLQERRRMVPSIHHKTSIGSNGSQSSITGWR